MEVVKHGDTYRKETCNYCCCEFTYTKKDIHYHDYDKEVRCPECNKCIKVGEINYLGD